MTILVAGATATISLLAKQKLAVRVAPTAYAVIEVQSGLSGKEGDQHSITTANWERSWNDPGMLTLTAYGAPLSYSLSGGVGGTGIPPEIQALVSGAGNGLRTVLIGHSYLDQESDTFTYNRPILNLNGTVNWMNFFLGWPLEIVKSHAIGGERLIDLEDRMTEALSESADLAIWNIGINDLKETKNPGNSRFTGRPYVVDPQQRNLAYCIDKAVALLKRIADRYQRVLILPETSPANGAGDQIKQLAARTAQYNRALQRLAASDSRMRYVPLDRVTWDPLSASAGVINNSTTSSYYADGIHPGPIGAFWRGKMAAAKVSDWIKDSDRLPTNIFETYTNQRVQGTSLAAQPDGKTLRVMCPNVSGSLSLIREGDMVGLAVPSAGNTAWNGRWLCTNGTSTYVELACDVPGSYTGTVNLSAAEQLFDNPLFSVQTGGAFSGGGTVTNALPSSVSINIPAGCTATATYPAHTDLTGAVDGLGSWLDLDISLAANAQINIWMQCHRSNTASPVYGRVQPWDIVQAAYDVEIVACAGMYSTEFGIIAVYTPPAAGQVQIPLYSLYRSGALTAAHPNSPARGAVMTGEWRVPATGSLDTLDGQINLTAGAAGGTIRIRLGRVGISAPRAALRSNIDAALDV